MITHKTKILEALNVDKTHILAAGKVVTEGDGTLVEDVLENGFERYINGGK